MMKNEAHRACSAPPCASAPHRPTVDIPRTHGRPGGRETCNLVLKPYDAPTIPHLDRQRLLPEGRPWSLVIEVLPGRRPPSPSEPESEDSSLMIVKNIHLGTTGIVRIDDINDQSTALHLLTRVGGLSRPSPLMNCAIFRRPRRRSLRSRWRPNGRKATAPRILSAPDRMFAQRDDDEITARPKYAGFNGLTR